MKLSKTLLLVSLACSMTRAHLNKRDNDNDSYNEIIETKNFKYTINCFGNYENSCSTYKKNIADALEIISNTFEIYEPITFESNIFDLKKYGIYNLIAGVGDTNYVALREVNDTSNPPIIYPQSLAKQLKLDKKPNYKKNDFILLLNNKLSKKNERISNVRIILHEIIHGLGFGSMVSIDDLTTFNDSIDERKLMDEFKILDDDDINNVKLLPHPIYNFNSTIFRNAKNEKEFSESLNNLEVHGFFPLTVFDKNIVDIKSKNYIFEKLTHLYEDFNKCYSGIPFKAIEYYNKIHGCYNKLNPETKEILSTLPFKNFIAKKNIGILTLDNTIVPLQTFDDKFISSSSVSHTYEKKMDFCENESSNSNKMYDDVCKILILDTVDNIDYYMDKDFLMNYTCRDNLSMETLLDTILKDNKHGLIGPGIISILKTLGWTEKGEKPSDTIYYLDERIEIPEQNLIKEFALKSFEVRSNFLNDKNNEKEYQVTDNEDDVDINVDTNDEPTFSNDSNSDSDFDDDDNDDNKDN